MATRRLTWVGDEHEIEQLSVESNTPDRSSAIIAVAVTVCGPAVVSTVHADGLEGRRSGVLDRLCSRNWRRRSNERRDSQGQSRSWVTAFISAPVPVGGHGEEARRFPPRQYPMDDLSRPHHGPPSSKFTVPRRHGIRNRPLSGPVPLRTLLQRSGFGLTCARRLHTSSSCPCQAHPCRSRFRSLRQGNRCPGPRTGRRRRSHHASGPCRNRP